MKINSNLRRLYLQIKENKAPKPTAIKTKIQILALAPNKEHLVMPIIIIIKDIQVVELQLVRKENQLDTMHSKQ